MTAGPPWVHRGGDLVSGAVDWIPLVTFPLLAEPGAVLAITVLGYQEGNAEFKLTLDDKPTQLFHGVLPSYGIGRAPLLLPAVFTLPTRSPLVELAACDTPIRAQLLIRTTRVLTLKNWSVVIDRPMAA